ncbi:MAG TPA: hypothetical protein VNF07_04885 [Acidimicrobiales bacterium]|nr:hypothetical protein [Acidimicrobiales bacterium]
MTTPPDERRSDGNPEEQPETPDRPQDEPDNPAMDDPDERIDEQGRESFPASDPPAH